MNKRALLTFSGRRVSINITLDKDAIAELKEIWNSVDGIQPPLVDANRNGLNVFLPWILKEKDK